MRKKTVLSVLIFMLLSPLISPQVAVAAETKVYINPQKTSGLDIGEIFSINISVSDVERLGGWHFELYYKSTILNATLTYDPEEGKYVQVLEGPFLKEGGETFLIQHEFNDNYNATHGRIIAACLLLGFNMSVSGSGTLATISFRARAIGNSILHFDFSVLAHPGGEPIDHISVDGAAYVGSYDIGITNLTPSKTVCNDTAVSIDMTVENQGESPVTSEVILHIDGNPHLTQTITELPAGESTTLTYSWDTTPVPLGIYTVTAEAILEGDVDPDDNTYPPPGITITITETIEGDINGDFTVDIFDMVHIALAFDSRPGDPNWNPNADLNNDDIVDIYDVVTAARNFGKSA